MMSTLRPTTVRLLKLAAVALLAGACASGGAPPTTALEKEPSRLYGIAGSHLVRIDPGDGSATAVQSSPDLADIGALTYDPGLDSFYAVAAATTDPRLIAIDRATGEVTTIGPIDLPSRDLTLAEGLAFDPRNGRLYAAAGHAAAGRSDFSSDRLLEVDVTTGGAIEIARIRGTHQDEADALAFAGGTLYAIDTAANSSTLYTLDLETGEASATGTTVRGAVAGLTDGAPGQRLYGVLSGSRQLFALPLAGGDATPLVTTPDATAFDGAELTALAFALSAEGPHRDSFESGDLSSWSVHEKSEDRREQP